MNCKIIHNLKKLDDKWFKVMQCTPALLPRTIFWPADSENTVSPPASEGSTEDDAGMWLADNSLRPTLWPAQDQLGAPEVTREE